MLIQLLIAALLSLVACGLLVKFRPGLLRPYPENRPQRFHAGDVPRLGGLAMSGVFLIVGWCGAWTQRHVPDPTIDATTWWAWLAVGLLPAWLTGVVEDVSHRVPAWLRLLATLMAAVIMAVALDLRIVRLGLSAVDHWWAMWPLASWALTILALTAMAHAFNIIDGYNGLASTVALMVMVGLSYVAVKVGDWHWLSVLLTMMGVTLGFWFWNYPRGLLFAGDSGAYVWGLVIAAAAIGLVQRNPSISPWFPVLLLAYPIMETLFSAYRKMAKGQPPSVADALHFHQLIYRRLVRGIFHDDEVRHLLMRNNRTSPYLWGLAMLAVVPAMVFWERTWVLIVLTAAFMVAYVGAYIAIVRFKVPRWLRRRGE